MIPYLDECGRILPLDRVKRVYVARVLAACGGDKTRAAPVIGISVKCLYNWLNRWAELDARAKEFDLSDEREKLSYDAAVAMLPDGDAIHTFLNNHHGVMIGADWERQQVLDLIREVGAELSGPIATGSNHGLAVIRGGDRLFIETRKPEAVPPHPVELGGEG